MITTLSKTALLALCFFASPPAHAGAEAMVQRIDPDSLVNEARAPDVRLAYKQVDGLELPMAIFLPANRASLADRRPAVLCIHGGAWSGWKGGDRTQWDGGIFAPHARYFAARGAVAVTISYRNVFQPGKDRSAFNQGPSLFDLLADCRSAMRFLRANAARFGIDPERIAVIGDSAGGHLAAGLGTIDRFDNPGDDTRISAMANLVIACNPITDLTDPAWLNYIHETPRPWEGGTVLSREARAKAISPLWNVSKKSAPTLAIHGLKDGIVNPRHSADLQQALEKAGVRSELSTIPDASHAFVLLGYRSTGAEFLAVMRTIDRFLVDSGYLTGAVDVSGPPPRGLVTGIVGNLIVNGKVAGTNGLDLLPPDATKPGTTTVQVVEDTVRGKALKLSKGSGGLTLSGHPALGTAGAVSLWIKPDAASGTLVSRNIGGNCATGFKLSLGKKGAITWQVAGSTLTTEAPPANAWSHLIASADATRATLWLNDRLVAEQSLKDATLIGGQLVVGESYAGLLSDVRIFDQAIEPKAAATPNP